MGDGMPELGSKISLISKADIRYEGRLYTVDPQECTIALSSVRSFGTEDRETQFQIAPQSQIYDYILFRGSDIKDIRVVNNSLPHPNDPAIMQVQLPNGQHLMPHFSMPTMNPPHAPPLGAGAYGNPFSAMGALGGMGGPGATAASLAPGVGAGVPIAPPAFMLNQQHQQQQKQQQQQQNKQQQQKEPTQVDSNSISNQLTQALSVGNGGAGVGSGVMGGVIVGKGSTAGSANNLLSNVNTNLANAALLEHKDQDLLEGASRGSSPLMEFILRKSPTSDMGVKANQHPNQQQRHNQQQHHHNNNQHPNHHQNNGGHGGGGSGGSGGGGGGGIHGGNSRDAGHKRQNHQQPQNRGGNMNNQRNSNSNDYYHPRDHRDSSGRNMDNYSNQYHDNRNGNNNYNNQRNNQPGSNRAWTMHRGQNNAGGGGNNNMMRNRGGGGRARMPNQGYRPMGGGPGGNQNKLRNIKNTIKFTQDFDFEQANNKFEELRSQLSKLKVGDEPKTTEQSSSSPTPPSQINGETDKKDDSGNETGAGDHEPEDEEITVGYDKTKSFFDNISCEAAQDRSKNKKNDWRQERKLNSETFGVSSTRRGSYRGRGNYNRNIGYNGGGYNRGYRGGNSYRNRNSNNRMGGGNSNSNNNANNTGGNSNNDNIDGSNDSTTVKSQQPQSLSAGAGGNASTSATSNAKTTTAQENSTQPPVAAVGDGQ